MISSVNSCRRLRASLISDMGFSSVLSNIELLVIDKTLGFYHLDEVTDCGFIQAASLSLGRSPALAASRTSKSRLKRLIAPRLMSDTLA